MNIQNGDVVMATPNAAKNLPDDYKPIEQGVDKNGKPFSRMRVAVGGGVIATVDISEADPQDVPQEVIDVEPKAE